MKTALAFVTSVSVLLAACILPKTNEADGSACSKDNECKSHRCFEGYCAGSDCKLSDASTCGEGWKCIHHDADPITGYFGNDGTETCQPTCGHCPGNTYCPKDSPSGAMCTYGKAPFELEIVAEDTIVGHRTRLTATPTGEAGRIVHCRWEIGDGKLGEETSTPTLERVFDEAREYWVHASCEDDGGRSAYAESTFTVTPR